MAIVRFAHRQNADLVAIFLTEQCKRTSGHGISGCLQLAVSGWLFFIVMFASGILTARLLYGRSTQA